MPKIHIANPDGDLSDDLWLLWLGKEGRGEIEAYVFAHSDNVAFEEFTRWAQKYAPEMFYDQLTAEDVHDVAMRLGYEWDEEWPDYSDPRYQELETEAERHMGLMTLPNGGLMERDNWGGEEIVDQRVAETVRRAATDEMWGHDFLAGDRVVFRGDDGDDSTADDDTVWEVLRVKGPEIDLGTKKRGAVYRDVPVREVRHV